MTHTPIYRTKRASLLAAERGSQIAEFAIAVPVLIVLVIGIFDFSAAFNLRQKLSSAAQEGVIHAAAQSPTDLSNSNPTSVQAILRNVFNYLTDQNVLPNANTGSCTPTGVAPSHSPSSLVWRYTITGCPDTLTVTIDRGKFFTSSDLTLTDVRLVGSEITVTYPYQWRFNTVIKLLLAGANYSSALNVSGGAVAINQL